MCVCMWYVSVVWCVRPAAMWCALCDECGVCNVLCVLCECAVSVSVCECGVYVWSVCGVLCVCDV